MKKTLLSVLAGLAVIGSANAAPSPADRKALCEKHPEKYVWVEKDQFCVPINPCRDATGEVKGAYCLYAQPTLPSDQGLFNQIMGRYLETQHKTSLKSAEVLDGHYMAVKTTDGGYYVISVTDVNDKDADWCNYAIKYAAYAYWKYPWEDIDLNGVIIMKNFNDSSYVDGDSTECQDIKDFASLLAGKLVYRYSNFGRESRCALTCPDPRDKMLDDMGMMK